MSSTLQCLLESCLSRTSAGYSLALRMSPLITFIQRCFARLTGCTPGTANSMAVRTVEYGTRGSLAAVALPLTHLHSTKITYTCLKLQQVTLQQTINRSETVQALQCGIQEGKQTGWYPKIIDTPGKRHTVVFVVDCLVPGAPLLLAEFRICRATKL